VPHGNARLEKTLEECRATVKTDLRRDEIPERNVSFAHRFFETLP
jgi:hypothetical protein